MFNLSLQARKSAFCLLACTAIGLTACAKPQTYTPKVSAEERATEQRLQEEYIKNGGKVEDEKVHQATPQLMNRVAAVYGPVREAGRQVCASMYGTNPNECDFPLEISDRKEVNAYADGKKVYVTPAMANFAGDDNELALVLSHEMAHNIMGHPASVQQNATLGSIAGYAVDILAQSRGINTGGAFSKVGANFAMVRYSPGFESEADYVGLYIMARGNYDYDNAANFWRRMSQRNPDAIYIQTTHPTNADRFVTISKTAKEIDQKKASGQPLLPNIKKE